ncbi:MAG: glucose-6-phosphate isomerase [Desulfovibrio sp.]|nr:glucose-6-phosphate isomerase [Desulfovibrio sp.]
MDNYLEWSRAWTGRLSASQKSALAARAPELATELAKQMGAGELPFLTMPYRAKLEKDLPPVLERLKGVKNMLVLGIGGSALGARAMQKAFAPGQDGPGYNGPWLWIADNVCAQQFEGMLGNLNPADTVVVCISKSGGTIETLAQYFLVRAWLEKSLGEAWREKMIVVTDANKGFLRQEANAGRLTSLEAPDFLGGRYSALSAVGLLPAGFIGIDWRALLDGAAEVAAPLVKDPTSIKSHPSFNLACWAKALMDQNYSELIFFVYAPQWATYGPWFAQLWAESLGKSGKGSLPVPATGVTDQHSVNQMFLDGPRNKGCVFLTGEQPETGRKFGDDLPEQWAWLRGKAFGALLGAEALGTRMALCQSGVPLVNLHVGNLKEKAAGATMMLLEAATIFTGWLMGINPVDQPAVELGKRLANSKLGAQGYIEEAKNLKAFLETPEEKQAF